MRMKHSLTFDALVAAVDGFLELPLSPEEAISLWRKLDLMLEALLQVLKSDDARRQRLKRVFVSLTTAASELARSLGNARRDDLTHADWMRFAARDLVKLKDELLALREFMAEEADFLRVACLRAQLDAPSRIDLRAFFDELHRAGAISESTWAFLMAQPGSYNQIPKDRETRRRLIRLSELLLELQEIRGESGSENPETDR